MNFAARIADRLGGKNTILRRLSLAALMIFVFLLQNTGGLFPAPGGVHAMLLVPLTVCIAMFERELAGVFYGLLAGAMLDAFSAHTVCFHGISLTIIGFICGALITYFMRNNLSCAMILSAASVFLYNSVYFIIFCASKAPGNVLVFYFRYYFLSVVYTIIFTPLLYFIVRATVKKFSK